MEPRHNSIIVQGDSHGMFHVKRALETLPDRSDLLHLGDLGVGFQLYQDDERFIRLLDDLCYQRGIRLYLIRGNHDNPRWWEQPLEKLKNIIFLKDYSTLTFPNGRKALCVGGGVSLDRCRRTERIDYWSKEKTLKYKGRLDKHDIVFAHDCPSYVNHPTEGLKRSFTFYVDRDKTLLDDCHEQRAVMDDIFDQVRPKLWVYGHYHNDHRAEINGCQFECFNINKLKEVFV